MAGGNRAHRGELARSGGRPLKSKHRRSRPIAAAPLAFLIVVATAEARPVPEPVRDQVFRASVELGIGVLNELQGSSIDVKVTGRYTRCPRPKVGLYACALLVRTETDGEGSACRAVVAASRSRWAWKAFECPVTWRPA